MSRQRQKNKAFLRPKIYFFVEGQTEREYLTLLKQSYKLSAATIVNMMDNAGADWIDKTNSKLKKEKMDPAKTSVYVVFDLNDSSPTDIKQMVVKATRKQDTYADYGIGFSNHSFEVWLLAHYEQLTRGLQTQENLTKKLTKYLGNPYKKGDTSQLRKILADDKVYQAIANAKRIEALDAERQSTTMGPIITSIFQRYKQS